MSERRADWPADVPNVNFPSVFFFLHPPTPAPAPSLKHKKGSHPAVKCWLIIRLDDCIYYLLPQWADS